MDPPVLPLCVLDIPVLGVIYQQRLGVFDHDIKREKVSESLGPPEVLLALNVLMSWSNTTTFGMCISNDFEHF